MNILEITYNHPAEVFIQRHLKALTSVGMKVQLIARHSTGSYGEVASVGLPSVNLPAQVMPNFDHLSLPAKLLSSRYLLPSLGLATDRRRVRDRVLLGYFRRLAPDLIHFHTASLAASLYWVPEVLGVPYTVSLRGSDIQVHPLRSTRDLQAIRAGLEKAAGQLRESPGLF